MGPVALAAAFLLSIAAPTISWESGAGASLGGASFLALALCPWLALAGLPRGIRASFVPARCVPAFALPPIALSAALDARAGADPFALACVALIGVAMLALLALAAERAHRPAERASLYGPLWLALVPGAALLEFALRSGTGAAPALVAWLARASPLGWCLEQARALPREPIVASAVDMAHAVPIGALLAIALLWIAASWSFGVQREASA